MQPEHLLQQAELLLAIERNGQPRQADKRRAVSTAYYAIFHAVLRDATDLLVGNGTPWNIYTLVYRSIDHRKLKSTCEMVSGRSWALSPVDPNLLALCTSVIALGELRNRADYDPSFRITLQTAAEAVLDARIAVERLGHVERDQKRLFLTTLAFPRRL